MEDINETLIPRQVPKGDISRSLEILNISVIVPTYNDRDNLRHCLTGIRESRLTPHEVIVIDDASTEPCQDIVDDFGYHYHRLDQNGGQAVARNAGAGLSTGNILLFVDSDVKIRPDTVEKVNNAYQDPKVMIYQGIASKTALNEQEGFGPQLMALRWYYMVYRTTEASYVHSHVFSIRKPVFEKVDGFDERFKPPGCGEEFDLGNRLREHYILHTDAELLVEHRFQQIWPRARTLFARGYVWAGILSKTKKFEKTNASVKEALIGVFSIGAFLFLPVIFFHPVLLVGLLFF